MGNSLHWGIVYNYYFFERERKRENMRTQAGEKGRGREGRREGKREF